MKNHKTRDPFLNVIIGVNGNCTINLKPPQIRSDLTEKAKLFSVKKGTLLYTFVCAYTRNWSTLETRERERE